MSDKPKPTTCRCAACEKDLIDDPAYEMDERPIYLVSDDAYVCNEQCLRRYTEMGDEPC
jgi:hypothetical protein